MLKLLLATFVLDSEFGFPKGQSVRPPDVVTDLCVIPVMKQEIVLKKRQDMIFQVNKAKGESRKRRRHSIVETYGYQDVIFLTLYLSCYNHTSSEHVRVHNDLSHCKQFISVPSGREKAPIQPCFVLACFREERPTQTWIIGQLCYANAVSQLHW